MNGSPVDAERGDAKPANPVARAILESLDRALTPRHLEIVDESSQHSVPEGRESHFRVVVVADAFDGKRLVARHRLVNKAVADQLEGSVHALAIQAYTPGEWAVEIEHDPAQSPPCLGGSKHDARVE